MQAFRRLSINLRRLPPSFLRSPKPNHSQIHALPVPIRASDPLIGARRGMAVAAAAEDGSPAKRLWVRTRGVTVFAALSPFVVCLAAGNLDVEVFRGYISQDAFFLRAFADAYEVAEDCADDDESKADIAALRSHILQMLKKRDPVLEEWGIDITKEITPYPATVKYTNFLQETAAGKVGGKPSTKIITPFEKTRIGAYTAGAMAPCLRLYAFLVRQIQDFLDPADCSRHPYKKWIDGHSYASFEASALQIEELLDKLSVTLTGDELEIIDKLYGQAMQLEIEFFNSQPVTQQTVVPLITSYCPKPQQCFVLFSDFDLTCSVVDSSAILAQVAILIAPKADIGDIDQLAANNDLDSNDQPIAGKSSADLKSTWHALSRQYMEEYEQCIENMLCVEAAKDFDYNGLSLALKLLSVFEKEANLRVTTSGVLKGLNIDDIKRTGELIRLQDGCLEFFQKILKREESSVDVHILSYCWCADLIRAVFAKGCVDRVTVHSNEFVYEGSTATGEIARKIESPLDKVDKFRDILKCVDSKDETFSVYIGDSVGDLLCLLEADIGIVVGSSDSLRRVGAHFGVSFVPLFHGVLKKQQQLAEDNYPLWKGLSGVLYTASSWAEIHAFILGV